MEKSSKNVVILLVCWSFTAVAALIAMVQVPSHVSERRRLSALRQQLSNHLEIENRLRQFNDSFSREADAIKAQMAGKLALVDQASFTCFPESNVNQVVEELQYIMSQAGVRVENLAYRTRESRGEYMVLPFDMVFVGSFASLREALHGLETHPAGILVEQLEFVRIDSGIGASVKLQCSVRFRKNA